MKTEICKKKLRIVQQMKKTEKKLLKKIESDFIWLVYHPGQIYQKFKEKDLLSWFQNLV